MSETEKKPEKDVEDSKVLRITDADPKFKYEINETPGGEKLMLCFQCGTCTADCPIARFTDSYRPRKLVRIMQLGLKDRALSDDSIWLCTTCFTCVDHCPQDVGTAEVIRVLRNLAVKEEPMPRVYQDLSSAILKTGYAYRIPQLRLKKRKEKGLPPLPTGAVESVCKLGKATGFSKLLEEEEE
ncbi:4Fe-4S dicluster domain-containing protein [Candidatus Bathyarchaeota archaeon]|nr:4Fe-4S dicluster domain-containing protein [Candidatus Bathyarchaeota archaeon]NIU80702.1 4Fe-4S dicluster domain-containing protein [Candidatus Bathyarchaeota archaeon]NIV67319.1 4Fe-4S dicluster domain-containing protein [Candidatus Bathyarchaeota archaeon]NIW16779.1 4Fe-4S dicluster domain-containing protein [Candidatus Bathyarchaeota archaeon]NIW33993.1 4Fe-4S dicluster domain-containing protein [Candidatus Bathyarchaeota archaeon]